MQSEMKGDVYMKLEGVMAEVILKLDPKKDKKYVVQEGGHDAIYVKLTKLSTAPFRPPSYSGRTCHSNDRSGDSRSTPTIFVWATR
jgi:hypothetical protein